MFKVSTPNLSTILLAIFSPIPCIIPDDRYTYIPSREDGVTGINLFTSNCVPYVL